MWNHIQFDSEKGKAQKHTFAGYYELGTPHVVSFNPHNCPCCIIILNLQMRTLDFEKSKELDQACMASKWQSQASTLVVICRSSFVFQFCLTIIS